MKQKKLALAAILVSLLSGCGQSAVNCSDEGAKKALENAIRKSLEEVAVERVKDENGSQPISNSSIRAAIAEIKLVIENIRTTKEDPNSTKKFCTGSLKIVFSPETFEAATKARKLVNLSSVEEMADSADVEKGADYLKGDLDYNVQPTDDGEKIFAEFENADGKLDVFGEVIAASLLKSRIEAQARDNQQQAEAAQREADAAVAAANKANLDQAALALKTADQALNYAWQSIDAETRKSILAQQRIWIKQKDSSCKVEALQSSTDPNEQKIYELQCKANVTNSRAQELQGYFSDGY